MKKYFTILAVMLSMAMVGCDKDETPEEKNDAVKASLVGTWEVDDVKADVYKGGEKIGTDVDIPQDILDELPLKVKFTTTLFTLVFEGAGDDVPMGYSLNSETGVITLDEEEGVTHLNFALSSDKKTLTIKIKEDVEENDEIDSRELTLTLKKTT